MLPIRVERYTLHTIVQTDTPRSKGRNRDVSLAVRLGNTTAPACRTGYEPHVPGMSSPGTDRDYAFLEPRAVEGGRQH